MRIVTPQKSAETALETIATPAGEYLALWHGDVLVFGILGPGAKGSLARFAERHGLSPKKATANRLGTPLARYFAGKSYPFEKLSIGFLGGTPFQRQVWKALAGIEFGAVDTYAGVATQIGRRGGARPVGQAVGANPITIVLPCHRVVGAAGDLTGFGCGLPVKRKLLAVEGWRVPANDRLTLSGSQIPDRRSKIRIGHPAVR